MPITAIMPLLFVICVSMIREGIEDFYRHKQDTTMNSKHVDKFNTETGQWQSVMWSKVEVGDLCRVTNKAWIPADLLLLYSKVRSVSRPSSTPLNTPSPLPFLPISSPPKACATSTPWTSTARPT